jgi:hypothetical protein
MSLPHTPPPPTILGGGAYPSRNIKIHRFNMAGREMLRIDDSSFRFIPKLWGKLLFAFHSSDIRVVFLLPVNH